MPTLLVSYVIKYLPWILAAMLVTGGWLFVHHLQSELAADKRSMAAAQTTIAQLSATNQQNLTTLKRLQAESALWQSTLTSTLASDAGLARFGDGLLATITAAPAQDDAVVAPVLQDTLASIAKEQGAPK